MADLQGPRDGRGRAHPRWLPHGPADGLGGARLSERDGVSARERTVAGVYDTVAEAYADRFSDELDAKPFDRGILARFAGMVADGGRVLDAGCGPGHIAAHLNGLGLAVTGLDLSTRMLEVARRRVPGGEFVHGNMLALPQPDGSFAGCVAMYSLHHLARTDLPRALAEIRRVLAADAPFLLALHCGHGRVRADHFLDHPVAIDGFLYLPERVAGLLATAGFAVEAVERRPPYRGIEAPYERVYALSRAA